VRGKRNGKREEEAARASHSGEKREPADGAHRRKHPSNAIRVNSVPQIAINQRDLFGAQKSPRKHYNLISLLFFDEISFFEALFSPIVI
jgi:hypothetical protein